MDDCLIVGGGVIGLSLAYELAGAGLRVRVTDRGQIGQEASWAGAGILPAAGELGSADPVERFAALSSKLHAQWAEQLRQFTGIDTGYRRCGGLHLACSAAEAKAAAEWAECRCRAGVAIEPLSLAALAGLAPCLKPAAESHLVQAAYYLPDEAQLRNPWHLRALAAACTARGVALADGVEVFDFKLGGRRIEQVETSAGPLRPGAVCLAAGAWCGAVAGRVGCKLLIRPIRGQIALLSLPRPLLEPVVNVGSRYLVPRTDGRLLIGSTEEDAGFDRRPTAGGIAGLLHFAIELVPSLHRAALERCWGGLRPASADGLPYLGRLPGVDNGFVAAGHFRSGLHLAPATAVAMAALIRGGSPPADLTPFRPDRHNEPAAGAKA